MGIHIGSKPIVTDGLVFLVDSSDFASYPRAGSSWFDLSENSNTGTINGSPSLEGDGSLAFDGSNDYVVHGDDTSIDLTTAASYCIWLNPSAAVNSRPFCRDDGSSNRNWWFYMYNDGTMWFSVMSGDANKAINHGSSWSVGAWHYYVGTYDSATGTKLYRNGVQVGSNSWSGTADNDDVSLAVGAYANGSYKFNGKISAASIYNRALTDVEIIQNFNSKKDIYGL